MIEATTTTATITAPMIVTGATATIAAAGPAVHTPAEVPTRPAAVQAEVRFTGEGNLTVK